MRAQQGVLTHPISQSCRAGSRVCDRGHRTGHTSTASLLTPCHHPGAVGTVLDMAQGTAQDTALALGTALGTALDTALTMHK